MKSYGTLEMAEGTSILNLTVPVGTIYPSIPNAGELFFDTTAGKLQIHNGTGWDQIASGVNASSKWILSGAFIYNNTSRVLIGTATDNTIDTLQVNGSARVAALTASGTVTLSTYGAGIAALSATGVVSSSATTGTGNVVLANSPTLLGIPVAPTASAGTNTTQIATTAYVASGATSLQSRLQAFASAHG